MGHPITGKRQSLLIYLIVWLIVAALHVILVWYLKRLPIALLHVDAFISVGLFAFLGLLAWYPTRYIPFSKYTPLYSFFAHAMAGALVLTVWLVLSMTLLNQLFASQARYREYLDGSLAIRAILGGIVYLVLVLIYYLLSYSQKLAERAKQEERLQGLVRDAELNMLKSQINPHFLFNSLNSISSLTMSNPAEARDMIIRLSDFLRYSLKHRENEYVSLNEELGRIKDYLAIEKVRFGDKLGYSFELEDGSEELLVPTMIFQPLFENAIRHSVYESLEPISIRFSCKQEKGFLLIEISNDYDPDLPTRKGTGVGLENVRQRIGLAYHGRGSVRWKGEDHVFIVHILIPLNGTAE